MPPKPHTPGLELPQAQTSPESVTAQQWLWPQEIWATHTWLKATTGRGSISLGHFQWELEPLCWIEFLPLGTETKSWESPWYSNVVCASQDSRHSIADIACIFAVELEHLNPTNSNSPSPQLLQPSIIYFSTLRSMAQAACLGKTAKMTKVRKHCLFWPFQKPTKNPLKIWRKSKQNLHPAWPQVYTSPFCVSAAEWCGPKDIWMTRLPPGWRSWLFSSDLAKHDQYK